MRPCHDAELAKRMPAVTDQPDVEEVLDRLDATDDGPLAPSRDQWRRHLDRDESQEFVVINRLRVADPAALDRYVAVAVPMVEDLGAELMYLGRSTGVLVGDEDDDCDIVSVWRWPSRAAWTQLWLTDDYASVRSEFNNGVESWHCQTSRPISLG